MSTEKIYLAGRVDDLPRLKDAAMRLEARGHSITARWVTEGNAGRSDRAIAEMDLEDIRRATWLILDNVTEGRSGGRCVELGYVLGLSHAAWDDRHRRISLVGPARNVFDSLVPPDEHFNSWDELFAALERKERPNVRHEASRSKPPEESPAHTGAGSVDPGGIREWQIEASRPR